MRTLTSILLFAVLAGGGCSLRDLEQSAANFGIALARGACHAASGCGVTCGPDRELREPDLGCVPRTP